MGRCPMSILSARGTPPLYAPHSGGGGGHFGGRVARLATSKGLLDLPAHLSGSKVASSNISSIQEDEVLPYTAPSKP